MALSLADFILQQVALGRGISRGYDQAFQDSAAIDEARVRSRGQAAYARTGRRGRQVRPDRTTAWGAKTVSIGAKNRVP